MILDPDHLITNRVFNMVEHYKQGGKTKMSYVIKYDSPDNDTYFTGMSAIGPMFGGTLEEAQKFNTKEDAIHTQTMHWGFAMTVLEFI